MQPPRPDAPITDARNTDPRNTGGDSPDGAQPAELPPGMASPLEYAIASRDRTILQMVDDALRDRRARLAFHPIIRNGVEARPAFWEGLIRIQDRSGRTIPARDFMATIDAHELGREVDACALELGLQTLRAVPGLRLAINMSARSIGYRRWMEVLERGIAADPSVAERLVLEISERSAMLLPEMVRVFMQDLQMRGVSFALDDFGDSFTSFRHLRDFDFDLMKIAGEFVRGVAHTPDNQVVVQAFLDLARHFEMVVVAESVETREDAEWLSAQGVGCLQGFLFGAPTFTPWWLQPQQNGRRAG